MFHTLRLGRTPPIPTDALPRRSRLCRGRRYAGRPNSSTRTVVGGVLIVITVLVSTVNLVARPEAAAGVNVALTPGDWVSFGCPHGRITLDGSTICNNQTQAQVDLGSGTLVGVASAGYAFTLWRASGNACFGYPAPTCYIAASSSVSISGSCPPGQRCGGSVLATFLPRPINDTNWAGYLVSGSNGSVAQVEGSWYVPSLGSPCPKSASGTAVSMWVGIDGYPFDDPTIEQAGTVALCSAAGVPSYYAWYAFDRNGASSPIPGFTVNPGDLIAVVISYNSTSSEFSLNLTDGTETVEDTFSGLSAAERVSAECILEAPQVAGGGPIAPKTTPEGEQTLADFGVASIGKDFTSDIGCSATVGGTAGSLGSFTTIRPVDMTIDPGDQAYVTALSNDGSSFSVIYYPS